MDGAAAMRNNYESIWKAARIVLSKGVRLFITTGDFEQQAT
jgi:hypothetical protein